jgi:16S rRNA (adenine1518-N6/adenine1519-N6)-dimethyltransferase
MKLFSQHGFNPRSDLGQNFLIDLNLIDYLVSQAKLEPHDVVLEVGAGTGGLTANLARQAAAVVSVEVDTNMYQMAHNTVEGLENVTLMNCDVLKNKNHFAPEVIRVIEAELNQDSRRRLKLVSNLPYVIATPVISNLVATDLPWQRMVVTIQAELALRMVAKPRTSQYSALSVWLQSQCDLRILKRLGPTVFWPRPKVNSAIVQLVPNESRRKLIQDRAFFHDFQRRLFQQRRKWIRSVLVGMYRKQLQKPDVDAILKTMGLKESIRAEEMGVAQLIALSNQFHNAIYGETQWKTKLPIED